MKASAAESLIEVMLGRVVWRVMIEKKSSLRQSMARSETTLTMNSVVTGIPPGQATGLVMYPFGCHGPGW